MWKNSRTCLNFNKSPIYVSFFPQYVHCRFVTVLLRRFSCVLCSWGAERSKLQFQQWPVGLRLHSSWDVHRLTIWPQYITFSVAISFLKCHIKYIFCLLFPFLFRKTTLFLWQYDWISWSHFKWRSSTSKTERFDTKVLFYAIFFFFNDIKVNIFFLFKGLVSHSPVQSLRVWWLVYFRKTQWKGTKFVFYDTEVKTKNCKLPSLETWNFNILISV